MQEWDLCKQYQNLTRWSCELKNTKISSIISSKITGQNSSGHCSDNFFIKTTKKNASAWFGSSNESMATLSIC